MASIVSKIVWAIVVASVPTSAQTATVSPGYGDDLKVTLLGDPAQLTFPLPPVSTFGPNPLSPGGVAKPTIVQLPTTPFRGVFKELDNARTDMVGHIDDNQPYFQFNMRTVTPTGLQFEQQYDVSSTIPLVDQYAKSLMQPDASGFVALGSGGAPGSKFYSCKTDLATRMSYCYKIGTTTARRAEAMKNRRYIFGADDRTPIPTGARTSIPYRHVGIVGDHCTGTLVGPRHVLTAGHCVHSGPGGDWIADLSFRPAYDKDAPAGTQAPYGKLAWARATTTSAWASSGNWNSDYAIIELAQDTGLGWMSFGWNSGISAGWNFNMNGYPGSNWGKMYHHYGALTQANTDNLRYTFDMVKGTSGSGVYAYWSNTGLRRIYGVNNVQYWLSGDAKLSTDNYIAGHTSPSWNQAVRITSSKFVALCGWINAPAALGC